METLYKSNAKEETRKTAYVYRTRGGLPYVSHMGMCCTKEYGFCAGYRFCQFWPRIEYGFRGKHGSEWTYLSFQFQMNKKEIEICEFGENFKQHFFVGVWISLRPGLKKDVKNEIFWSEIGSGLENRAAHPYQEFPGVSPGFRVWKQELFDYGVKPPIHRLIHAGTWIALPSPSPRKTDLQGNSFRIFRYFLMPLR